MILGTVRRKIIANSAVVFLIIAAATFSTDLASSALSRSVVLLFQNNQQMEDLSRALERTGTSLTRYLSTKSSDSLKDYIRNSRELAEANQKLNREIRSDESLLLQRDLAGLVDSYLDDAAASIEAKRGRDVQGYTLHYEDAERAAKLARVLIVRIEGIFMADSIKAFSGFNARINAVLASNGVILLSATLLGLVVLVMFSTKLTEPLTNLAEAAEAVGRGEYDHELALSASDDEIGTTAAAFSSMQASIRQAFEDLQLKAEVEKRLMEERVLVLDMDKQLKAAELLALQTQINPHFLFNTLSAGLQLALSENAERTGEFLENLAAFIRYALRPPSRLVRVADEIESLNRYLWLLRLRFGTRYAFDVAVDQEVLDFETPALLLQPLVENAILHGLKNREEGGVVRISARVAEGEAVLSVYDSGDGMTPEQIARVQGMEDKILQEGGIGLRNVIRRVSLATGGRGRVTIENVTPQGTLIRVFMPVLEVV